MSANTEQRKLAAIMFTDMVGYSALSQRNEALALELLEEHRALLRPLFPKFNGAEIKTIGDAFLVEFHSALEAAQCGIEIQRALAHRNHDVANDRRVEIKIGIHIGDVVHRGGDIYGDGVNIAARIEALAGAGGICVSMDVERQIRNALEARFEKLAPTELKNISVAMDLFRIVLPWEEAGQSEGRGRKAEGGTGKQSLVTSAATRWGGIAALVLAVVGFGWWAVRQAAKETKTVASSPGLTNSSTAPGAAATVGRIQSLLVKPLDNFSGETNQGFFVDGMTEELITRLSKVSALTKVISRTTAMQYRNTKKTVPEIARELQVDGVLEGSVLLSGSQVRITVQLIDGATDRHLWAESYTRDVTNVLRLQNEVALAVVREIKAVLKPDEQTSLTTAEPINPAAYRAYLTGRSLWNQRDASAIRQAIGEFQRAVELAPDYANAYGGLADCYLTLPNYSREPALVLMPLARAALEKALALNPKLAEAHTSMAMIQWRFDYDWAAAEQRFQKALAIDPNYPPAHYWYAILLTGTGHGPDALRHVGRAVEIDPLSPAAHWHVGYVNMVLRRYDAAITALEKLLSIDQSYSPAYPLLGEAYFLKGDEVRSFAAWTNPAAPISPASRAMMEKAYQLSGMRGVFASDAEEEMRLAGTGQLRAFKIAERLAACGDTRRSLQFLEQAYENRSGGLIAIVAHPFFDQFRSEPRFQALLKKVGFDK